MILNKINLFSLWLITLLVCVISIILIGGYTRISDSGLSITEWEPISGILFPLTSSAWIQEFDKYKLIDEFKLINSAMTLQEFKVIYFWEWFHRAFARLIGAIYIIPFIYLAYNGKIEKKYLQNLFIIGLLLIIQAFIGWYMVKSGLVNRVDVSQYRLALHLTTAFIILGFIFHTLLSFYLDNKLISKGSIFSNNLSKLLLIFFIFTFFQISYGAFVSGTHSGLVYNTWPLYDGYLIPNFLDNSLFKISFLFENSSLIIFIHRSFALLLFILLIFLNYKILMHRVSNKYLSLIVFFNISFFIQAVLGIAMTYLNIPWYLALLHQGNSIAMFLLVLTMYLFSTKSSLNET
jgi:cytochrome c oxidase assembly protein subunit 15